MAWTAAEEEYYYETGLMPIKAWAQQNGRSPEYNYQIQKKEMYRQKDREAAARRREKAKKQIEQQILDAIVITMQQGEEMVAEAAADDIVTSINAALGGGSAGAASGSSKRSFTTYLGVMLGKALGQAPFKLLDDIFKYEDEHNR